MADTQAPQKLTPQQLEAAFRELGKVRIAVGLDVKPSANYKFQDVLDTFSELKKDQDAPIEYAQSLLVIAARVAQAPHMKPTPQERAQMETNAQQINYTATAQQAVSSFVIIRVALGLPEQGQYSPADVAATKAALDTAKKDPNHLTVMYAKIPQNLKAGFSQDELKTVIAQSDTTFAMVTQMTTPAARTAAPAAAATPAPAFASAPGAVTREVATGYNAIRVGLGLPMAGTYTKANGAETVAAYDARLKALGGDTAKLSAEIVTKLAASSNLKNFAQKGYVDDFMKKLPANVALLNQDVDRRVAAAPPAGTPAPAAAGTPAPAAAAAPPAADKSKDIRKVEEVLAKLGINVGQVDGKADEAFHAATTNLKNLIASVAGVQVSAGACTPNDCDELLKGITSFLGSQEFKDLQEIRQGNVPDSMNKTLAIYERGWFKGELLVKNEAERIEYALNEKAKRDPAFKEKLDRVKAVSPQLLSNMPLLLDTLKADGADLAKSLKVVYTPTPGAPTTTEATTGTTTVSTAGGQTQTTAVPTTGTPGATASPVPGTTQPPAGSTPPAGAPAGAPATLTPEQQAALLKADIEFVEGLLHAKISPILGKVAGGLGKFGLSSVLPTITEQDLTDGVFGDNSKRLTATVLMGLKEMAGEQGADGTYDTATGDRLKLAILTKPEMEPVRKAMNLPKMTDAEAKEALKKKATELTELNGFFDRLERLKKQGQLLAEQEAQSVTKGNMMIDAASGLLDKWAPGLKRWLVDFLKNSQIGQMVGAALGFMGMDVSRLWGEKNTPAQLVERSAKEAGAYFKSEFDDVQKKLGPDATIAQVLEETKRKIIEEADSTKVALVAKALLPGADKDVIKNTMKAAAEAAAKAGSFEAAQQAFSATLAAAGQQWQKGKTVDFSTLDAQANAIISAEAVRTNRPRDEVRAEGEARPVPPSAPAAGAAGATATPSPVKAPGAIQTAPLATPAPAATETPVPKGGMRFEVGEKVVTLSPKDVSTETDKFKQFPMRASKGRMADIAEVIYQNFDKLGITGIKKEDLRTKDNKPVDGATPALTKAMIELSVRSQLRMEASEVNPKLNYQTIYAFTMTEIMHKVGTKDPLVTKAATAVESMNSDHGSVILKKGEKAPKAGSLPSVIEQSFAGYQYNVKVENKPAPAPVAPAAAPAAPATTPAPAAAAASPVDKYAGITVPAHLVDLFEKYKQLNAGSKDPNCKPLYFALDDKGNFMSPEEYKAKREKGEDLKDVKFFAGIVDQAAKKFEVHEVFERQPDGTLSRGILPKKAMNEDGSVTISGKLMDNYNWGPIDGKVFGRDSDKADPDKRGALNNTTIPKVIAFIQEDMDCKFGIPSIRNSVAPKAPREEFKQAAQPPAAAAAPAPQAEADQPARGGHQRKEYVERGAPQQDENRGRHRRSTRCREFNDRVGIEGVAIKRGSNFFSELGRRMQVIGSGHRGNIFKPGSHNGVGRLPIRGGYDVYYKIPPEHAIKQNADDCECSGKNRDHRAPTADVTVDVAQYDQRRRDSVTERYDRPQ